MIDSKHKQLYEKYNIDINVLHRDYIENPLKRGKNQHDTEHFIYDDLYYLYITLNIKLDDLVCLLNMKKKSIRRELLYHHIKKDISLSTKNFMKYINKESKEERSLRIQKSQDTKLKRYGDSGYHNINKMFKTNQLLYGDKSSSRKLWSKNTIDIINSKDLLEQYIIDNKIVNGKDLAEKLKISPSVSNKVLKKYNLHYLFDYSRSKGESEVRDFINQYYKTKNNSRNIIPPYELDIFIPEKNIAIEYNGDFWHSSDYVKQKDIKKRNMCKFLGIKLITVWESEWENNKDNVKKMLLNELSI